MKIKLAGFNVDIENINKLHKIINKDAITTEDLNDIRKLNWTPETISASYARISRDPRPINELREEAGLEIEKARKSNKAIIFDMGHSSIAEHAVFNIDIIDISRLLSEELEKSRLVSFTEKSQRYIKIGKDALIPEEFKSDNNFLKKYTDLTEELFNTYDFLHEKILPYFLDKNPQIIKGSQEYRDLINLAKEDARYILPLSTLTQLGMTVNARNLERIIRKSLAADLFESKIMGNELYKTVEGHAPSLVKYTTPTDYETKTYDEIKKAIGQVTFSPVNEEVKLNSMDNNFENNILASMILKTSDIDTESAAKIIETWSDDKKEEVFKNSYKYLNSYDPVLREYEMPCVSFNILISATAFAQMKRHRMATIIDGEYSPKLGVKIPQSIIESGQDEIFLEKIHKIEKLFEEAKNKWQKASNYILSNAHRKNIVLKCNFRELIHIARLRCDKHSQWDIRSIADLMINKIKSNLKFTYNILCGKDKFERYN